MGRSISVDFLGEAPGFLDLDLLDVPGLPRPPDPVSYPKQRAKQWALDQGVSGDVFTYFDLGASGASVETIVNRGLDDATARVRSQVQTPETQFVLSTLDDLRHGRLDYKTGARNLARIGVESVGLPAGTVDALEQLGSGNPDAAAAAAVAMGAAIAANAACASAGIPPGPCGIVGSQIGAAVYQTAKHAYENIARDFSGGWDAEVARRRAAYRHGLLEIQHEVNEIENAMAASAHADIAKIYMKTYGINDVTLPFIGNHVDHELSATEKAAYAAAGRPLPSSGPSDMSLLAAANDRFANEVQGKMSQIYPDLFVRQMQEVNANEFYKTLFTSSGGRISWPWESGWPDAWGRSRGPVNTECLAYSRTSDGSNDDFKMYWCMLQQRLLWYKARLVELIRRVGVVVARDKGVQEFAMDRRRQQVALSTFSVLSSLVMAPTGPSIVDLAETSAALSHKGGGTSWKTYAWGALALGAAGTVGWKLWKGSWPWGHVTVPGLSKIKRML